MKKVKQHSIHVISHWMSDEWVYVDFKPNKQQIKDIARFEWGQNMEDDEWEEYYKENEILCNKIDLWTK